MEDKEIAYLLVILAQFFFMVCLLGVKQKQPETRIEVKLVEVTPTPSPTEAPKRFHILDSDEPKPDRDEYKEEIITEEYKAIEEESLYTMPEMGMVKHLETADGLQLVRMTCYLPTGNCCADGTMPKIGGCAAAPWQIGKDCIIYRADTLEVITKLECHDTGGHYLLQTGQAIDVFAPDMEWALNWVGTHGSYVYIRWVERGEE